MKQSVPIIMTTMTTELITFKLPLAQVHHVNICVNSHM